jgi:hypothetical protein
VRDVCRYCGEVKRVKLYGNQNYCKVCSKLIGVNRNVSSEEIHKEETNNEEIRIDDLINEKVACEPSSSDSVSKESNVDNEGWNIKVDQNEYLIKYKEAYTKALKGLSIYLICLAIIFFIRYAINPSGGLVSSIVAFVGLALFIYIKSEIMATRTLSYQQGVLSKHPTIIEEASRYGLRSTLVLNGMNLSSYNLELSHLLGNYCEVVYDLNSNTNIKSARKVQRIPMLYSFTRNLIMVSSMTYLYSLCLFLIVVFMSFSDGLFYFFILLLQLFALIVNYTILVDNCMDDILKNEELEDVFIYEFSIPIIKRIKSTQKFVLYLGSEENLHKKYQIVVGNSFHFVVKGILLEEELDYSYSMEIIELLDDTSIIEDQTVIDLALGVEKDFFRLLQDPCLKLTTYEFNLVYGIAKELYANGLDSKKSVDIPLNQVLTSRNLFNKEL